MLLSFYQMSTETINITFTIPFDYLNNWQIVELNNYFHFIIQYHHLLSQYIFSQHSTLLLWGCKEIRWSENDSFHHSSLRAERSVSFPSNYKYERKSIRCNQRVNSFLVCLCRVQENGMKNNDLFKVITICSKSIERKKEKQNQKKGITKNNHHQSFSEKL